MGVKLYVVPFAARTGNAKLMALFAIDISILYYNYYSQIQIICILPCFKQSLYWI